MVKIMKRIGTVLFPLISIAIVLFVIYKLDDITDYTSKLINPRPSVVIDPPNIYSTNENYLFVRKSYDFVPYSKQDLIDIFYSILDNGYTNFTFYCPSEYIDCTTDMQDIINNQILITDIGNFVHPFNSFHDVQLTTTSTGEIDIEIHRTYSDEEITAINNKLNEIFASELTNDMDIHDKLLKLHDYIIDNTEYSIDGSLDLNAYNLLYEGDSKCFGYADTMAIILHKLGVKNIKVGSEAHVWNAVYLDGRWQHMDVTWDDPVVENSNILTNMIRHKFYLIDTPTILSYDTEEHNFNQNVYLELKKEA